MPLAKLGSLVLVKTEVDAERNARTLQCIRETEVGGGIIGRISAEDDEDVHFAAAHVSNQILQRRSLIYRVGIDRIGIEDRLADIAEGLIDGVGQGVDGRRLMISRDHHARTAMAFQLLQNG